MKQLPARHKRQLNWGFFIRGNTFGFSLPLLVHILNHLFVCCLHLFFSPLSDIRAKFPAICSCLDSGGLLGYGGQERTQRRQLLMHTDKHSLAHTSLWGVFCVLSPLSLIQTHRRTLHTHTYKYWDLAATASGGLFVLNLRVPLALSTHQHTLWGVSVSVATQLFHWWLL